MDNRPECLIPADASSIDVFSRILSPEHKQEIGDLGMPYPAEAVRLSLRCSKESYAYMPDKGKPPVFIFGVENKGYITRTAMVWMLAAPEIIHHKVAALRSARWGVGRAFAITGAIQLEQYIPEWYQTGLRFVQRLGFIPEKIPGPSRTPLVRVTLAKYDFESVYWNRGRPKRTGRG